MRLLDAATVEGTCFVDPRTLCEREVRCSKGCQGRLARVGIENRWTGETNDRMVRATVGNADLCVPRRRVDLHRGQQEYKGDRKW